MVDFAPPLLPASQQLLLPQHQEMLTASGVCADVAAERGYQSVTVKARLKELGFSDKQLSMPTLLVPIHSVFGGVALQHHRPDEPRINAKTGKLCKYEFPAGSRMAVDCHPRLLQRIRNPRVPLFITEGVKKADAAVSLGLCCIALIGTWNWRGTNEFGGKTVLPDWDGVAFKDKYDAPRQMVIVYDSDVMRKRQVYQALVRLSAFLKSRGASVEYIYLPHGEDGSKVGLDDYLAAGHTKDDLLDLITPTLREIESSGDGDGSEDDASSDEEHPSAAQRLVALAGGVKLFHTERGENYGRFAVAGHLETWPLRSQAFRHWISREYHNASGKPVGSQAIEDALRVLEAKARYEGEQHALGVRCVRDPHDGSIWIDAGDAEWRTINVQAGSWRLYATGAANDESAEGETAEMPEREDETQPETPESPQRQKAPPSSPIPLLFRRHVSQAALAVPDARASAGDIDLLRPFVNVRSERDWKQLVAWLVAAWVPEIGHPVLVVHGEQGTAKSTLMRLLTMLIDPSHTPLRSEPRDLTAWVQMADHTWLVTLDNVSALPGWLSDAMCRAVTGEAFVKRQLYTDAEDVVMAFRRVVALTGIEVVAQRSDLLDRSILLGLEPIAPDDRRPESEVLTSFEAVRPKIVAALLTILSGVLIELPHVTRLGSLPRMADFARVGVAVGRVLGWAEGEFMRAYGESISEQNEEALASLPIVEPLIKLLDEHSGEWNGTSPEMLQVLTEKVGETASRRKEWPQSAKALSSQLRRIAPNLRSVGIELTQQRSKKHRMIAVTRQVAQKCVTSVTSVTPRSDGAQKGDTSDLSGDTSGASSDTSERLGDTSRIGSERDFVLRKAIGDTCDAGDTFLQPLSYDDDLNADELADSDQDESVDSTSEDVDYLDAIRR